MRLTNLGKVLLFFVLFSTMAISSGFAAVDIAVGPDATIPVSQTCEMDVAAGGSGTIAGVQLDILFDDTRLQLQSVDAANNVWTNDMASANFSGCLTIVYLDTDGAGINADTGPVFATLTFESIDEGQTEVRIDSSSIVSNSESQSIDGVFTGAMVKSQTPQSVAGSVVFSMAGLTDLPLENASVTIDGEFETTTDSNGQFNLGNVSPGVHTLCIDADAFEVECFDFALDPGGVFDAGTTPLAVTDDCTTEINNAVSAERGRWDANADNKKGLPEAIDALQTTVGIEGQE